MTAKELREVLDAIKRQHAAASVREAILGDADMLASARRWLAHYVRLHNGIYAGTHQSAARAMKGELRALGIRRTPKGAGYTSWAIRETMQGLTP